jgi:hypothetical protein
MNRDAKIIGYLSYGLCTETNILKNFFEIGIGKMRRREEGP